ncbi:hypothetical protein EFA46_015540 (plasmid) [Halarchaeum sp. CBA1220]|uniref:hypothetical protein n=1 Tax=Halarchaeum sp. CBA1220 TaxID=1853682 RepID=UPI000F3AA186|nr:hypothetical protein [Halarchaeum sp. CBA1220]QLC35671.1 hypothetical protein EFA46_015540 [Halarchaeum sp. CBA1220]
MSDRPHLQTAGYAIVEGVVLGTPTGVVVELAIRAWSVPTVVRWWWVLSVLVLGAIIAVSRVASSLSLIPSWPRTRTLERAITSLLGLNWTLSVSLVVLGFGDAAGLSDRSLALGAVILPLVLFHEVAFFVQLFDADG